MCFSSQKFSCTIFISVRKPDSMHLFSANDDHLPLSKFESMLKTNSVYFFDSSEFEEIVLHYMNVGKMSLAKKALELLMVHLKSLWTEKRKKKNS